MYKYLTIPLFEAFGKAPINLRITRIGETIIFDHFKTKNNKKNGI